MTPPLRIPRPGNWPVRWRLAAASAGLTLIILLAFAGVIGHLASERLRDDFDREMRAAVRTLAIRVEVTETPAGPLVTGPELNDFALPNDAIVRIFDGGGTLLAHTRDAPPLGPWQPDTTQVGSLRVTAAPIVSSASGRIAGYVQYARNDEHVESTIERLWLFIAAGVLGAVILASMAGLAIASRAMRPIASLTATAGEIATTRDPSRHMPRPSADDEVGELTRTLEQMLRSLDAARNERERAMQKQREFVADASHELRTPLTSVIANLELVQASLETDEGEDREMVDSALRSSRRMSRLVGDLLLLARADAGRTGERTDCDLAKIAASAMGEIAPVSGRRRVELAESGPLLVRGNPDELHRMLVNLLDNAVRHTPDGSRVELTVRADSGRALIEVADNGPGIPDALRDEVFSRFVRGDGPADTVAGGGSGLGLAIVRAVAQSHGGDVEAQCSRLGGALFTVSLPLRGSEERAGDLLPAL
jgi:two-component system, OmpR family, sensor kinase